MRGLPVGVELLVEPRVLDQAAAPAVDAVRPSGDVGTADREVVPHTAPPIHSPATTSESTTSTENVGSTWVAVDSTRGTRDDSITHVRRLHHDRQADPRGVHRREHGGLGDGARPRVGSELGVGRDAGVVGIRVGVGRGGVGRGGIGCGRAGPGGCRRIARGGVLGRRGRGLVVEQPDGDHREDGHDDRHHDSGQDRARACACHRPLLRRLHHHPKRGAPAYPNRGMSRRTLRRAPAARDRLAPWG